MNRKQPTYDVSNRSTVINVMIFSNKEMERSNFGKSLSGHALHCLKRHDIALIVNVYFFLELSRDESRYFVDFFSPTVVVTQAREIN